MTDVHIYCDGGVVSSNPSQYGGTWAWRILEGDTEVENQSGLLTNDQNGGVLVTNNVTEMLAALRGVEAGRRLFGMERTMRLYSDSWVTLTRLFQQAKRKNLPLWLSDKLDYMLRKGYFANVEYTLLNGHPTKAELETGVGKRGYPTSIHNVWCDKACGEIAREFLQKLGEAA